MVRRETSSSISYTASFPAAASGQNVSKCRLSFLTLLMGKFPIAFQRGTVNNLLVGRHLFPDRKFRIRENPVLGGNVLCIVVKFFEVPTGLDNIAAGGKVAALVDGNIPPVCLIIKVIFQIFRDRQVLRKVSSLAWSPQAPAPAFPKLCGI